MAKVKSPARTLADIRLDEDDYKADFQLTDKYQTFSAELLRLSLLGIAGYGFLISNIAIKDSAPSLFFKILSSYAWLLGASVVCLGLAAGTALAHRFYSTHCLSYQIEILRLLKRGENTSWTEAEQKQNQELLIKNQSRQRRILSISRWLIGLSVSFLLLGTIGVAYTFAATLFGV